MSRRELVGILIGVGTAAVLARIAYVHYHAREPEQPRLPPWTPALPPTPPKGPTMSTPPSNSISPETAVWLPTVNRLIKAEFGRVDGPFAMAWMQMESDGNACAVGDPGSIASDGNPREIGLGQLYNPDDFQAFGVTAARFRAYAPPAAPLAGRYLAAKAINDTAAMKAIAREMQTATRPLTDAEKDDNVRYTLLKKIDQCIGTVNALVAKDGIHWTAPDWWKLVKAPHALPKILNEGMPAVITKLGRTPTNWSEFRAVLGMDAMMKDPATGKDVPKHPQWVRALNACEKCGNAVAGSPAVS